MTERSSDSAPATPAGAKTTAKLGGGGLAIQFDWRQVLIVLRAHFLTAATIAIVACTLLGWQQMRRPKLYASAATLALQPRERMIDLGRVDDMDRTGAASLLTRLGELQSREVAEYVVRSLDKEERAQVLGPGSGRQPPVDADTALLGIVRGSATIERLPDTLLLSVQVRSRDSQVAALIANRYAEQFIRYLFDKSSASSNSALVFLREQAEDLRKKLEASERSLQEYRAHYNMVSLDDSQNIVVDRLKALNASATAARVRRSEIEVRLKQAEAALSQNQAPVELATLAGSSALVEVQQKIDDTQAKQAVMAERYGRRHPIMQELARTLTALERLRDDQIKAALTDLRTQRDKAVAEEKALGVQLSVAETDALKLDQIGVEYGVLKRAIETQKTIYSQVLSQLNEASISAQLESVNIRIADRATPNPVPVSPNLRKTVLLLVALALSILVVYPVCVELLFARVRSGTDVEYYLGAALLGEIGVTRKVTETDRPHLVERDVDNPVAEQFRALYSQLQLVSRIDPPKAILITSTVPGEGKSFVASNLASAFVAHARKVLLIDADLRRPSQHRSYRVDNKAGLLRWLDEGGVMPENPLVDERLGIIEVAPNLHLLRTGGSSRRASELVAGGKLTPLFAALQRRFDVLVFDTPPSGVFPDAIAFAPFCHELIFISRFGVASRHHVRGLLERWRKTELDIPGVVLNALPSSRGSGYYYHHGYNPSGRYAKYYAARPKD